jgi:hypothetical protein
MSKRKITKNAMSKIPVYCNRNTAKLRKLILGKKERIIITNTTLTYGGVKSENVKSKARGSKMMIKEFKRNYYRSFVERKKDRLESLSRNQLHLVALNGKTIGYSVVNVVAVREGLKRYYLVSDRCPNSDVTTLFYAFRITPESLGSEIINYISLLNNFDESSTINYFDSYYKQKGGIRLNPISFGEIIIFELPDGLIDYIDFTAVPTLKSEMISKSNEVFIFNSENKSISFGSLSETDINITANSICGGLVYSIWDLKHPIGLNVSKNKCIYFKDMTIKKLTSTDSYLIEY